MHFNQKLFLGLLVFALTSACNVFAQSEDSESNSQTEDKGEINAEDQQFINEINRLYRDSDGINKFAQFSKPWQAKKPPQATSPLIKAREEEAKGRYLAACADYLAEIRELINSKGSAPISALLDSISRLVKKLDKNGQRTVCKAMLDLSIDRRRFNVAKEHSKDLESILLLALNIKDQLKDQDEQLIQVLMELGAIRASEKDYQPAIDAYKRALALIMETKIEDDSRMMNCVVALSAIYDAQQNYNQAELMLKGLISSLEANRSNESKLHPVPYMLRLYTVYKQSGKLKRASETASAITAIVDEYAHKTVGTTDSKLAYSIIDQMKSSALSFGFRPPGLEDDERLSKSAFKFKLKVSGFGQWVAYDLASLCQMLSRSGKTAEAISLYRLSISKAEELGDQQSAELLQQRMLSLLSTTDRHAEKVQLEEKLKQRKEQKNQDTYKESIDRLSESRVRGDQDAVMDALLLASSASLDVQKRAESRSYLDEAIGIVKKIPASSRYQDNAINQIWTVTRAYLAHAENKEEEHVVYVVAELDEQRRATQSRSSYSTMDLSSIVRFFLDKQKPVEAEEFIKYVIDLRKHYRPTDTESIIEANNQLRIVYMGAHFQASPKLTDVMAELVKLYTIKYGADDIRTMRERATLSVSLLRQNKPELAEKAFAPVLLRLHQLSSKGNARTPEEVSEINEIVPKLIQIADAYLLTGNIEKSEKYTRQALGTALVDEYQLGAKTDRIVRNLLSTGQFLKASEFIQLRLHVRERSFGVNSFEAAQQRLQLSEVYFKYARQLSMQGKKSIAKEWSEKSEATFKQALAAIELSQGADSVAAKDAVKKREMMLNPVQPNVQSGDDVT